MSYHEHAETQASSEPQRPLRGNFTSLTMRRARVAKARRVRKHKLWAITKERFSMKSPKFLRTIPGAALTLAVLTTGSMGAFALSNWFNGNISVRQNDSILSVDLSSCKGSLPPGVDSTNTDRSNVQFKILGSPHISAEDLESQLLAQCEFDAVRDFYATKGYADSYLVAATVAATDRTALTFTYAWGGEKHEKTVTLAADAPVYKEGGITSVDNLYAGDAIVIAVTIPANRQENVNPMDYVTKAESVFVTRHDVNIAPNVGKKALYEEANIMPLDQYNQINTN